MYTARTSAQLVMFNPYLYYHYLKEERRREKAIKKLFYKDLVFKKIDRALLKNYAFKNPYRISKQHLKSSGDKQIHIYGETPLSTFETIAKECEITEGDTVIDMGVGRARGAIFLNHFKQCRVIGYEKIPHFVEVANQLIRAFDLQGIEITCEDMFQADLSMASVIYLYGTCLEDNDIESLIAKFSQLKVGTKIVTISYPLTEYAKENVFTLGREFTVSFPWGETSAYLNIVGE